MNILKDSSYYQLLQKRERLLQERERLGEIKEAKKLLIRLGRIRFGRLDKATRAAIEAIEELGRLEHLSERVLTATTWADLLDETK